MWLALLWFGCAGESGDTGCELINWWLDADGDGFGGSAGKLACAQPTGFVEASGDCDDQDASVNPYGAEICNGANDDCDWMTDELPRDGRRFYKDGDGDGYGTDASWQLACEAASGFVTDARDCNDQDAEVHPDASEICDNGEDDDCDGLVDDEDPAHTWYADNDGDGLGDPYATALACSAPSGHVANNDDCDDDDPLAFTVAWYADADADGYGAGTALLACAAPSGHVDQAGDCDDADEARHPEALETCDGLDSDCDGADGCTLEDGTTLLTDPGLGLGGLLAAGEGLAAAGATAEVVVWGAPDEPGAVLEISAEAPSALWLGDLDGDGVDDLIVGSATTGAIAWTTGPLTGAATPQSWSGDGELGTAVHARMGFLVASAPAWDEGRGRIHVLGTEDALEDGATLDGEARGDRAGSALLTADLDGDGQDELVVGAGERHTLYVWDGPIGAARLTDAEAVVIGELGSELGASLAAGDVDGDGLADAVAGGPGADAAWVFSAPLSGEVAADQAWAVLGGSLSAGASVAVLDDADGDGRGEVAMGAPDADGGEAWVWLGPEGQLDQDGAWLRLHGDAEGDGLGTGLATWAGGVALGAPEAWGGDGEVTWIAP